MNQDTQIQGKEIDKLKGKLEVVPELWMILALVTPKAVHVLCFSWSFFC